MNRRPRAHGRATPATQASTSSALSLIVQPGCGPTDAIEVVEAELVETEQPQLGADIVEAVLDAFIDEQGRLVPARLAELDAVALSDGGSQHLHRARLLDDLRANAWADSTLTNYGSHVRGWRAWCREQGVPALPLDPLQVANHLVDYAFAWDEDSGDFARDPSGHLVPVVVASTASSRLHALNKLAVFVGLPKPGDNPGVIEVMRGLRRSLVAAPELAKQALDLGMVERCLGAATGLTLLAARDRAACLLRARTGATAGQLACLHWADVTLNDSSATITLAPSHRHGKAQMLTVRSHENPDLCLVQALRDLRALVPSLHEVLTRSDGRRLTRQALHLAVSSVGDGDSTWSVLPALRDDELMAMLGERCPTAPLMTMRDRALLLTGFYTALRRVNLAMLNWGDLDDHGEDGWSIRIRRSKTDQEGKGRTLWVPVAAPDAAVSCPASALRNWKAALTQALGREPLPSEAVFANMSGRGGLRLDAGLLVRLDGSAINSIVQRLVAASGIHKPRKGQRCNFGAHSLRAGFVTEALRDDKLTIPEVQEVTGHASVDVLVRYRREVNAPKSNPSRKLLGKLAV